MLSDEESGGKLGARFLVEEHPELPDGVEYAIGEFGGFSLEIAGRRFYPMMVAEKQICVAARRCAAARVTGRFRCVAGPWPGWAGC